MKKAILLLIGLFFFVGAKAQDAAFMNTHHSLVNLNPSFAGSNGFLRNQTVYRNQWPNLSGTMVTYGTCFDGYIKPIKGGLAISVMSDDMNRGTLRHTQLSATYAQYISVGEYLKIIPSIQATYAQYSLNKGRLNFGDPLNNRFQYVWTNGNTVPNSIRRYTDISSGLLLKFHHNYLGVSCAHINEPNISMFEDQEFKMPIRTTIHTSSTWAINPSTNSNILLAFTTQGQYQSFNGRVLNSGRRGLIYGLGYGYYSYSAYHQLAGYLGFTKKAFTLSYCYDRSISTLSGSSVGSHELSFSASLKRKNDQRNFTFETK